VEEEGGTQRKDLDQPGGVRGRLEVRQTTTIASLRRKVLASAS
jgi:hypothetical protein